MNNDITFLNREWRTRYSLTNFKTNLDYMPQLLLRSRYVWFPSDLYIGVIPNSNGQLAELIVYTIPLE